MRKNNKNKFDKINRRIFLFVIFKFFAVTYIIERLYNLQIRQSEKFKKLAENNRINSMFIIPARGIIYDRNNLGLAENIEQYQLIYRYTNTKDKYDHLVQIFKHIDLEKDKKVDQETPKHKKKISIKLDYFQIALYTSPAILFFLTF